MRCVVGLCEIEQTEKGWYITLIDKDPDAVKKEMESERKEKMDLDDEQRRQKLIAEQVKCSAKIEWKFLMQFCRVQIKRDKEKGNEKPDPVYTEFVRKDEEEKGRFQ